MKRVLVTGTMDILHIGHIRLLEYSKSLGDLLNVAIDSDDKVKKDKGESRPFNNQNDRKDFLLSIKVVDNVTIFSSEEDLEELCRIYKPDIRVVGSDWKGKKIVGSEYCREIVYFDRIGDYSTSKILGNNR